MYLDQLETSEYVLVNHNPQWIEVSQHDSKKYEELLALLDFFVSQISQTISRKFPK